MSRNQRDIVFATLNLFNLQLPGQPTYPNTKKLTKAQYRKKIAWTARTIETLDADVIAFQELWSPEALVETFEETGLADQYTLAFIKEGGWDGIAVAAAVRKPWEIKGQVRHKAFPPGFKLKKRGRTMADIRAEPPAADDAADADDPVFVPSHEDDEIEVQIEGFSRSVLQVTVDHAKARDVPAIEVFCTHLKSRRATRLDDPEYNDDEIRPHATALGAALSTIRRTSEAAALRVILNDAMADTDTPVVVLGDLNDGTQSNTLAILSDQPSFRVYADSRTAARNDDGLYTAATMQALRTIASTDHTYVFKAMPETIDHVMVSEQFYEHSEKRRWAFRNMKVWNDHLGDDDGATSDHGLVRCAFDWLPVAQKRN